jgi:hypothetical protein
MNLDLLGNQAAQMMMRGAVDFLRAKGITADRVDLDALVAELRARSARAVDEAMRDARDALAVPGMERIAEATFATTMRLHGIEAAKAVVAK